ncbi:MAG: amidase [Trueperaceae bacterium]|nr:amidase [Trueperaceae bacterium]
MERLTIAEASELLRARTVSPVELIETHARRIERLDGVLNAFVTTTLDEARAAALAAEATFARGGARGPLHAVPVAHKDIYFTRGVRTTAGSRALADHVPDHDATVVELLAAAGAISLGKANCHELACGAMQGFGVTRNPWDPARAAGGSSSGSAAAVAAGLVMAATASDTGGSVRVPASFTGTVGLKPTFGRVSRHGLFPISYTLDHPALLTACVADAETVLGAMTAPDPKDRTTVAMRDAESRPAFYDDLAGLRLGVPTALLASGLDPEVEAALAAAVARFEELGATCVPVDVAGFDLVATTHSVIWLAEGASRLRGLIAGRRESVGAVVARRMLPGLLLSANDYFLAMHVRERLRESMGRLFATVDALVLPTTPFAAHAIDDLAAARSDVSRFNRLADLTGEPALALPCGFTAGGLPIGMQLMGRAWSEGLLLRVAGVYERATRWSERTPNERALTEWRDDGRAEAYLRRLEGLAADFGLVDGGEPNEAGAADWVRRRAAAAGLALAEADVDGLSGQARDLMSALAGMRASVDLAATTSALDYLV